MYACICNNSIFFSISFLTNDDSFSNPRTNGKKCDLFFFSSEVHILIGIDVISLVIIDIETNEVYIIFDNIEANEVYVFENFHSGCLT